MTAAVLLFLLPGEAVRVDLAEAALHHRAGIVDDGQEGAGLFVAVVVVCERGGAGRGGGREGRRRRGGSAVVGRKDHASQQARTLQTVPRTRSGQRRVAPATENKIMY